MARPAVCPWSGVVRHSARLVMKPLLPLSSRRRGHATLPRGSPHRQAFSIRVL
jgi:hypothetical protein